MPRSAIKTLPSTRGGLKGECLHHKICRTYSIEVNQPPHLPPSPMVQRAWFGGKSYSVLGKCLHLDQPHHFHLNDMFNKDELWSWIQPYMDGSCKTCLTHLQCHIHDNCTLRCFYDYEPKSVGLVEGQHGYVICLGY